VAAAELRPPLLRVSGVHRTFDRTHAVAGVDLEVGAGEYFCVLGPSGSGKSTLLRMIGGFEAPDVGEIHLAGTRVDPLPPERRDVNTVFQGYALFPHLTVFENVAFGLRVGKRSRDGIRPRVEDALDLVGLVGYGNRRPDALSGGERQRVALARAVVNRPRLLLLDEPLAALDRKLRLRMQSELLRIQAELEIAFVHVTHDQEEALRLADRLGVMDRGRLLQVGTPEEVYHRPRTAFVADFLGSANLFRGRALEHEPPRIALPDGTPLEVAGDRPLPSIGEEGAFAVRPEALRPTEGEEEALGGARAAQGAPDRVNRLRGTVESHHRIGGVEELRVRAGGALLTVHAWASPGRPLPRPGEAILLAVHPRDVVALEGEAPGAAPETRP